jgi:hypothetical protein
MPLQREVIAIGGMAFLEIDVSLAEEALDPANPAFAEGHFNGKTEQAEEEAGGCETEQTKGEEHGWNGFVRVRNPGS